MPSMSEISLPQGRVLYEVGGPVEVVYLPSSAVASVVTVMSDGRSVETSTIGRESGVGLLNAVSRRPMESRVFVQVGGAAFRMPASALRNQVLKSADLNALLLVHVHATLVQTEQFVACNALHNAEQRLARWLIMTADRTGTPSFPLTQEYMAVMTGVQRTTVSALAATLKERGLIGYRRGQVEILDRKGLSAVACECAGIAHGQFKALRDAGDDADFAISAN
jgi:CRP-like cAMP-binding protein